MEGLYVEITMCLTVEQYYGWEMKTFHQSQVDSEDGVALAWLYSRLTETQQPFFRIPS